MPAAHVIGNGYYQPGRGAGFQAFPQVLPQRSRVAQLAVRLMQRRNGFGYVVRVLLLHFAQGLDSGLVLPGLTLQVTQHQ